jgi:hypothetical protein
MYCANLELGLPIFITLVCSLKCVRKFMFSLCILICVLCLLAREKTIGQIGNVFKKSVVSIRCS